MNIWRHISPLLSPIAMMLVLLASLPASTWHECDHHLLADHSSDSERLLEDHRCDLCDYQFSGFHYIEFDSSETSLFQFAKKESLYDLKHELIMVMSTGSRAPPLSYHS